MPSSSLDVVSHWRRPQRPDLRLLSRCGRAQGPGGGAPYGGRRRRGHGGVRPRVPQLDRQLHRQPAEPEGHPRPEARRARAAGRRAPVLEFRSAARWPFAQVRRQSRRNAGGSLDVLPARCRAPARVLRAARPARGPVEAMGAAYATQPRRPVRDRGLARPRRRGAAAAADGPAAPRRAARPDRRLHEERGRLARPLVRIGTAESRARLGFGRRQLREPLRRRVGLRAAASLLRRSERQAREVGPCDRRHGGHYAGNGGGSAGARRRGHDGGSGAARGRRERRGGRR